jgi:hypothetical protein
MICSSETTASFHRNSRRFIPEDGTLQTSITVVPKVGSTVSLGVGVDYLGGLRGKGAADGAGGGLLRMRFSFIYDLSDFRPDNGKMISLQQAYRSHK